MSSFMEANDEVIVGLILQLVAGVIGLLVPVQGKGGRGGGMRV